MDKDEIELYDNQVKQIDNVNNTVYDMVAKILNNDELLWDMEWVGELSEIVVQYICEQFQVDYDEIYPYVD